MTRPPDPPRHNTPGVIWAKQPGQFDDGGGMPAPVRIASIKYDDSRPIRLGLGGQGAGG